MPCDSGVPVAAAAMFDPNQGQQGQPPQQIMFQGQSQGQGQVQLNVTPQNAQGQQGPQQRRYTEEERQKVVASLRQIVEKYGQESPQAKQAHAQFKQWMLQYYTHAHNRQQGQSSEPQTAQGRQAIGHSVANPAQFKPPANGDPQAVHRFRLGLTSRYAQGQQRMKQIREQLHIQSNKVQALQAAGGQGTENQQLQQIKANMTELARQFKTIDAWCQGALQSGQLLTQPNRMQTASETATVSATVGGGSQQPSIAGIDQQQQEQQPQPTTAPALAPASAPESTPTPAPESAPALAPESALPPASASAPASAPVSAPAPAPAPPPSGSQPGPPPAQQNLGPPQQVQQQGQVYFHRLLHTYFLFSFSFFCFLFRFRFLFPFFLDLFSPFPVFHFSSIFVYLFISCNFAFPPHVKQLKFFSFFFYFVTCTITCSSSSVGIGRVGDAARVLERKIRCLAFRVTGRPPAVVRTRRSSGFLAISLSSRSCTFFPSYPPQCSVDIQWHKQ